MTSADLQVLPEYRDENGVPSYTVRRWDAQRGRYAWFSVLITKEELEAQTRQPVRLSHEPKYWLFRNRFVLQVNVESEPDRLVDLLEEEVDDDGEIVWSTDPGKKAAYRAKTNNSQWRSRKVKQLQRLLVEAGESVRWTQSQLDHMVRNARRDIFPTRHSELARYTPDELVLRVKHVVLRHERGLDKLKREIELLEKLDTLPPSSRRDRITTKCECL